MAPLHNLHLSTLAFLSMLVGWTRAFVPRAHSVIKHDRSTVCQSTPGEGLHGSGSRFMPLIQLIDEDIAPRIVAVAGVYPGITGAELMAPKSAPAAPLGMWQFDFSDADSPQLGTVALGPNNACHLAVDPVVVVCESAQSLGLSLANDVDTEVLALIDRADKEFTSDKFFAFQTPDGSVALRWFEELPPGHAVLGKLLYVTVPYLSSMQRSKSGFMEDDDGFNF